MAHRSKRVTAPPPPEAEIERSRTTSPDEGLQLPTNPRSDGSLTFNQATIVAAVGGTVACDSLSVTCCRVGARMADSIDVRAGLDFALNESQEIAREVRCQDLSVNGGTVVRLAATLVVQRDLEVLHCVFLAYLADNLRARSLTLNRCVSLTFIGSDVHLVHVTLMECPKLRNISCLGGVTGRLVVYRCDGIEVFPELLDLELLRVSHCSLPRTTKLCVKAREHVTIVDCDGANRLILNVTAQSLTIRDLPQVTELSAALEANHVHLARMKGLLTIKGVACCASSIHMAELSQMEVIAATITAPNVVFYDCGLLRSLPAELHATDSISINSCKALTFLSERRLSADRADRAAPTLIKVRDEIICRGDFRPPALEPGARVVWHIIGGTPADEPQSFLLSVERTLLHRQPVLSA